MLGDELELLQNIYIDELIIDGDVGSTTPVNVTIHVHPATCDNADEQYVRITATFQLPPEYPAVPPTCDLSGPRGLADDELTLLKARVDTLLASSVGMPMLHEAIELIREVLTNSNVPHGLCSICLEGFDERATIAKTDCYHYFHARCLARYVLHCSQEPSGEHRSGGASEQPSSADAAASVRADKPGGAAEATTLQASEQEGAPPHMRQVYPCPVCRKLTSHGGAGVSPWVAGQRPLCELASADGGGDDDIPSTYVPTADVLRQRERMRRLYERQQQKGGIIDVEAEQARLQLPPPLPPQAPASKMQRVGDAVATRTAVVVPSAAAAGAEADASSHSGSTAAGAAALAVNGDGCPETPAAAAAAAISGPSLQPQPLPAKSCSSSFQQPKDKPQRPPPVAAAAAAATGKMARSTTASNRRHHGRAVSASAAARSSTNGGGGSGGGPLN